MVVWLDRQGHGTVDTRKGLRERVDRPPFELGGRGIVVGHPEEHPDRRRPEIEREIGVTDDRLDRGGTDRGVAADQLGVGRDGDRPDAGRAQAAPQRGAATRGPRRPDRPSRAAAPFDRVESELGRASDHRVGVPLRTRERAEGERGGACLGHLDIIRLTTYGRVVIAEGSA